MKKFSLVLILVCLLMLKCGEQGEKVIGSRDHDIKTLKATTPEILADGISTTQIIATVYDKNGVAAQNKKVIFRTTYGSIEPYTYTNSDGMAVVLLMSIASTTDLMAEVTATVVDTTFESLGKEQPSPFIITLHIPGYDNEPQSLTKPNDHTATIYVKFLGVTLSAAIEEAILPADGLTESRVTIKLQETTSQKAIPNAKVQLALKYGTVVSSTTTDNQGKAEVYLRAATQAGKDTLRVDYGNKLSTSLNISYVTPKLELSSNTAQVPADGESKIQIIATVVTHKNTPIVGAEVKFSASAGIIKESAITDQYGKAKVELIAGRKPDLKVVVLAKFLALKDSVTVAFISTLHDYPNSIILEADPNFIWVKETGNLDQTTIIATVLGVTGLPVGNDFKVKFSIANGPDGGETIEPSSSSDKKSSIVQTMDGQAKAYFRAGIRSGTVQIRAELVDYPQVAAQTTNIVIRSGPPYMWIDPTNVNHVIPHATML
ncbi:MAG: Ig-like domain-containing protein, partial [candidate division KSB1 bacterium]|nr:Ig-like domain-containing protein [candidate division KSB1 bacterium]